IKVTKIKKYYDGEKVLDIESLGIERGKITAVIGPSGAGKSTLLHLLNKIELPSSGNIWFEDNVISDKIALTLDIRRSMIMVFQKPLVFKSTVYDNIAYGLKIRGVSNDEIGTKVEEMLEVIGLKDKKYQRATTLSGGEAQRVAIARAVVVRPKALLLDEPTANLDPANVTIVENLVKYGKENYKLSVLMVTHNMFQARRLSDNTIFMLNGSVVEAGSTEGMFNSPQDENTRAFINGKMIF
ncbi:MAG: phosphate ABC transporter ATP-binding protein, partial [Christensenellales bacterium]